MKYPPFIVNCLLNFYFAFLRNKTVIIYFVFYDILPYDTEQNLVSLISMCCVSEPVSGEVIIIISFIFPRGSKPYIFMCTHPPTHPYITKMVVFLPKYVAIAVQVYKLTALGTTSLKNLQLNFKGFVISPLVYLPSLLRQQKANMY